jgi:hypothetical protein
MRDVFDGGICLFHAGIEEGIQIDTGHYRHPGHEIGDRAEVIQGIEPVAEYGVEYFLQAKEQPLPAQPKVFHAEEFLPVRL